MFQYALGRQLALKNNVPLKLDLSWFKQFEERPYLLDAFQIEASEAVPEDIYLARYYSHRRVRRIMEKIHQKLIPYYRRRTVVERSHLYFDPNILNALSDAYLSGYWQSEKYFAYIAPILKKEFTPVQPPPPRIKKLMAMIEGIPQSASLHLRRGDYLGKYKSTFSALPLSYYHKAADWIASRSRNCEIFIFSDDIKWVRQNLKLSYPMQFVSPEISGDPVWDMQIMRACRHHIIANSSFSWWGAWLGEREGSITIAPNQWYRDLPYPHDRIPERWVIL